MRRLAVVLMLVLSAAAEAAVTAQTPAELFQSSAALPISLPDGRQLEFRTELRDLGGGARGVTGTSAGGDRLLAFRKGDFVAADVYASGGRYRPAAHRARPRR